MGASAIMDAIGTTLAAAAPPPAAVYAHEPLTFDASVVVYAVHEGYHDNVKANGQVQRVHRVQVRLLVRITQDAAAVEGKFLDLMDAIADAFYADHTLAGTCGNAELKQFEREGIRPLYLQLESGPLFRMQEWVLEPWEYRTITFA